MTTHLRKLFDLITRLYINHFLLLLVILSFVLNVTVEALSRRSLPDGIVFAVLNPLAFLFNTFIIFTVLSVSLLFKRRIFFLSLCCALWLACGVTNYVVMSFRVTPFSATDLLVFCQRAYLFN